MNSRAKGTVVGKPCQRERPFVRPDGDLEKGLDRLERVIRGRDATWFWMGAYVLRNQHGSLKAASSSLAGRPSSSQPRFW